MSKLEKARTLPRSLYRWSFIVLLFGQLDQPTGGICRASMRGDVAAMVECRRLLVDEPQLKLERLFCARSGSHLCVNLIRRPVIREAPALDVEVESFLRCSSDA